MTRPPSIPRGGLARVFVPPRLAVWCYFTGPELLSAWGCAVADYRWCFTQYWNVATQRFRMGIVRVSVVCRRIRGLLTIRGGVISTCAPVFVNRRHIAHRAEPSRLVWVLFIWFWRARGRYIGGTGMCFCLIVTGVVLCGSAIRSQQSKKATGRRDATDYDCTGTFEY